MITIKNLIFNMIFEYLFRRHMKFNFHFKIKIKDLFFKEMKFNKYLIS